MMSARAFLAWLSFSVLLAAADQPSLRAAVSEFRAQQVQSPSAEHVAAHWAKSLPSLIAWLPTASVGDLPGTIQALTGAKLIPGERAFPMTFAGKKVVSGTVRKVSGLRRGAAAAIPDGELKQAILRTTEGADDIAQSASTVRRGPDGVETKSAAGKVDAVYAVADQAFDQARRFDIGAKPRVVDRKLAAQPGSRGGDLRSGYADTGARKLKTCPNPQEILGPTTAAGFVDGLGFISEFEQRLFLEGGEEAVRDLRAVACFTADTKVVLADGRCIPISTVKAGDVVLSRPDECPDRSTEARRVLSVQHSKAALITQIQVRSQDSLAPANDFNISCTPTHPFWRIGSANGGETGWILASELKPKDVLRGRNRNLVVCASVTDWESQEVYNLRIDGEHTYFVAQSEATEALWTHNACTLIKRFDESVAKAAQDPLVKKRILALVKKSADEELSAQDLVSLWKIASETKPASLPGVSVAKEGTYELIHGDAGMLKLYPGAVGVDGPTLLNFVAHHILPGKALQEHELSKIVGIIFDHGSNGIWLPGKAGGGATKTVHAGKHAAYSEAMFRQMDKFLQDSGMQLSNPNTWTKQALNEARNKIARMQKRAVDALNEGKVPLIQNFEGEQIEKDELVKMWTKVFEGVL